MKYIKSEQSDDVALSMELQKGVFVTLNSGETVNDFIQRVLSIDEDSMNKEIQTLILNNGCVDEPETVKLVSGDTLVLSGAMPGLVGAMLRSNSPIKAMRQSLSASERNKDASIPEGMVKLKLFNSVLTDHKKDLLNCGFYIEEQVS